MSGTDRLVRVLLDSVSNKKKTAAYDTQATVLRVEGDTAWVHIPGGVDETPVKLTIAASPGDTVQVRVSGGSAWINGNQSAPPTDDTLAREAKQKAEENSQTLETTVQVLEGVQRIAGNTNQYFWHVQGGGDTGAHITEKPQSEFMADPDNGGGNLLARSNGIAIRNGMTELATFDADGVTIGNSGDMLPSEFTRLGARLAGGAMYVRYGRTTNTFTGDGTTTTFSLTSYAVSKNVADTTLTIDGTAVTDGYILRDIAVSGGSTQLIFDTAPASGASIRISFYDTRKGFAAIGTHTLSALAGGDSLVVGYGETRGYGSLAQGFSVSAAHDESCAHGYYTQTGAKYQAVFGKYNTVDANALFIVGNGDSDARSNAFTVDNDGIATASGGYGGLVAYEDVPLTVSFAAGTIGTRAASLSAGSIVKSGYTYIGAYIQDHRNTSKFSANIAHNGPNNTAHLCVYRATGDAVTDAEVTVRKVWLKTGTEV